MKGSLNIWWRSEQGQSRLEPGDLSRNKLTRPGTHHRDRMETDYPLTTALAVYMSPDWVILEESTRLNVLLFKTNKKSG